MGNEIRGASSSRVKCTQYKLLLILITIQNKHVFLLSFMVIYNEIAFFVVVVAIRYKSCRTVKLAEHSCFPLLCGYCGDK